MGIGTLRSKNIWVSTATSEVSPRSLTKRSLSDKSGPRCEGCIGGSLCESVSTYVQPCVLSSCAASDTVPVSTTAEVVVHLHHSSCDTLLVTIVPMYF